MDCLCGARGDGDHEVTHKVKNEFLQQMDGVATDNQGVLVLGATNRPWSLDDAFMRRFQKHIYIPPPEQQTRSEIARVRVRDVSHSLNETDFAAIAAATDGWSGSDLSTLIDVARNVELDHLPRATHFLPMPGYEEAPEEAAQPSDVRFPSGHFLQPCSAATAGAVQTSMEELLRLGLLRRLKLRDVSRADVDHALSVARPAAMSLKLSDYEAFTKKHGMYGNK